MSCERQDELPRKISWKYKTSKRPSRILKQVKIGSQWIYKKDGSLHRVIGIIDRQRYPNAKFILIDQHWLLPPRYFWDLMEKADDEST
jgi:hypothetical protein